MNFEYGIPFSHYRKLHLIFALPAGVLLWLYIFLCRVTSRIEGPKENLPANCILFFLHRDYYTSLLITSGIRPYFPKGLVWLGYHGFYSYVPWIWFLSDRIEVCRYRTEGGMKPFAFIKQFMESRRHKGYCQYTDSGGPYGRVRESLVKLAIDLDRPLVASRVTVSRRLILKCHQLPLPFSLIRWTLSVPIPAADLARLTIEEGRELVQSKIDALAG